MQNVKGKIDVLNTLNFNLQKEGETFLLTDFL